MTDERDKKAMNCEMQTITLSIPKFEGYTPTGRVEQVTEGMYYYDGSAISKWKGAVSSEHHYVTFTMDNWRAAPGRDYYTIDTSDGGLRASRQVDMRHNLDNARFQAGLYFEHNSQASNAIIKLRAALIRHHEEIKKP